MLLSVSGFSLLLFVSGGLLSAGMVLALCLIETNMGAKNE